MKVLEKKVTKMGQGLTQLLEILDKLLNHLAMVQVEPLVFDPTIEKPLCLKMWKK